MKAKLKPAAVLVGTVEVLGPLALVGWGVARVCGGGWAALVVGGLLWLRYMADVVRRS